MGVTAVGRPSPGPGGRHPPSSAQPGARTGSGQDHAHVNGGSLVIAPTPTRYWSPRRVQEKASKSRDSGLTSAIFNAGAAL